MADGIVDLFAGPGGWDEGLRLLGRTDVVGLEWEWDPCRTAVAAGHARIQADVANYPAAVFAGAEGVIASPPCPSWSRAGNRAAFLDIPKLEAHLDRSGHRNWGADAGPKERHFDAESIDVDIWQLGVLQSFRPDYPWRGSKTSQGLQVGNAVPPLLAAAVLRTLVEATSLRVGSGPATAHGDSTEGCGVVGKPEPPVEDAPPVAPTRTEVAS